jgi:hypothetical protein
MYRRTLATVASATLISTVGLTAATTAHAAADMTSSRTFEYTGAPQTFTVPFGVTAVEFDVSGASGGDAYLWSNALAYGGLGGRVTGVLAVTPGEVLTIVVGGRGANGADESTPGTGTGGYNGGGNGGAPGDSGGQGAGGGGGSDIRAGGTGLGSRVVVAAGGGGATPTILGGGVGADGGAGGGIVGVDGGNASGHTEWAGKGATATGGGAGGSSVAAAPGSPGGLGYGGAGGSVSWYRNGEGGGGGGGYYGGGGGSSESAPIDLGYYGGGGGGGGGSSYAGSGAAAVVNLAGQRSGNGVVILSWRPVVGGTPSGDCTGGTIFDGTTAGVYTKLRLQLVTPTAVWVCFRFDAGSLGRIGGKIVLSPAAGVANLPSVDANSAACSGTTGNLVPGPHPLAMGTLGDALLSYSLDTYASPGSAWACLSVTVAGVAQNIRVVVPAPSVSLPGVAVLFDGDSTLA